MAHLDDGDMHRKSKHLKDLQFARRLTLAIIVAVILLYLIITLKVFSESTDSSVTHDEVANNSLIESVLIEGFPINLRRNKAES